MLEIYPCTGRSPAATTSCRTSLCVLRARQRTQNTQTCIKGLFAATPQCVRGYCPHGFKCLLQKLPLLSTTVWIRYTIAANCSADLWEGVLLRKSEQDRIPHSLLTYRGAYSSWWPAGRGQSGISLCLNCTTSVSTRRGWEVGTCCRQGCWR